MVHGKGVFKMVYFFLGKEKSEGGGMGGQIVNLDNNCGHCKRLPRGGLSVFLFSNGPFLLKQSLRVDS